MCNRKYAKMCLCPKISKRGLQLSPVDSCTLQLEYSTNLHVVRQRWICVIDRLRYAID